VASVHEYRANRPNTWLLLPRYKVKILPANPEPSTHGPSRHFATLRALVAMGAKRTMPGPAAGQPGRE
jgi:hypothetical protein